MTFNGTAASTIGALLATACMRAGREAKGKHEIGLADAGDDAGGGPDRDSGAGQGAGGRQDGPGRAGPRPRRPCKAAAEKAVPLPEALTQSLAAAEAGLKATIPMKSKMGRAAWIAERSVGHQDPGATSFYLMWKSAVEYLTA